MAYKIPAAVNSIKKTGLDPALTGAVELTQGANVTLTQAAQAITIAAVIPAAVNSIQKTGSAALTGAVTLTGGSNITLTQASQDISIAATVVYPQIISMLSAGVTIPSDSTTYEYGQILFTPTMIGAGQFVRFCANARLGDATKAGTIALYDLTSGILITGGSLTIPIGTTAYQYAETAALPVGEDPGEIHPGDPRFYAAHLTCAGTNGALEVLIPSNIYLEIY